MGDFSSSDEGDEVCWHSAMLVINRLVSSLYGTSSIRWFELLPLYMPIPGVLLAPTPPLNFSQICRFCWHRIRTEENNLCPACRQPYSDKPAEFNPVSKDEYARLKAEKRQKKLQERQELLESRKQLQSIRVVQKNLVYVAGLPQRLADEVNLVYSPSPTHSGHFKKTRLFGKIWQDSENCRQPTASNTAWNSYFWGICHLFQQRFS